MVKSFGRICLYNGVMIILSVGMPRAGSGWYYNLTNDLMMAAGGQDARLIRQRFRLHRILTEVNCNIGALTTRRLAGVMLPSVVGNTFVIKAHAAPTMTALSLIKLGHIRPSYIFRDPRDAMLSAMENGRRAIDRGRPNAFSPYIEFQDAFCFIEDYLRIGSSWMDVNPALKVRYEDLLLNYDLETDRLIDFLQIEPNRLELSQVIERYRPEKAQVERKGLHFSHGRIGRFRQKMSLEQQEILGNRLGSYLALFGYEL